MDMTNYPENENKRNEIRNEDKKALPKLLVLMIISGILGGVFALCSIKCMEYIKGHNETSLLELFQQLQLSLASLGGYLTLLSGVLLSFAGFFLYRHYRKQSCTVNLEDDENREHLENGLSAALLITSVNTILSWVFFGVGFYCITQREVLDEPSIAFAMIGFILTTVCSSITQQKVINLEKEMNPEKNGSVYDLQFHKKWMESCDEAERLYIYKCGFAAYKTTQITCMTLAVLLVLLGMIFPIGILPLISVCILWGTSTIVYSVTAMKIDKIKE